jgi:hypothetical protein
MQEYLKAVCITKYNRLIRVEMITHMLQTMYDWWWIPAYRAKVGCVSQTWSEI